LARALAHMGESSNRVIRLESAGSTEAAGPAEPVFISYASADALMANRVCEFLETHATPCWIAPRDVRAGDLYADAIVKAINACPVLIVILSERSVSSGHVLREVERASAKQRPLISLRLDTVALPPAMEYFLSASHWLDASDGNIDRALQQLIDALRHHFGATRRARNIDPFPIDRPASRLRQPTRTRGTSRLGKPAIWGVGVAIALGLAYLAARQLSPPSAPLVTAAPTAPAPRAAFAPPPHSLAVLPFVNLSGDSSDDYFSDGLTVELLDSLARIRDLQVVARTSSFSFKDKNLDIVEIARRLNVGALLEGSIRKQGKHVRIAATLINARTGFRLWSESFDRDLQDVLQLQTEIATAVTSALEAKLFTDGAALLELGGTRDPQAFDAYLKGEGLVGRPLDETGTRAQLAAYDEAIRLDPKFAKAYIAKALAEANYAGNSATSADARDAFATALADARTAVALAPELGEAHSALAFVRDAGFQDYQGAAVEYERAMALAPGNARVLTMAARFFSEIGRSDAAVTHARRAVVLDPLNAGAYRILGLILLYTHHYTESVQAFDHALSINPQAVQATANRGLALLALGDFAAARESCASPPVDWLSHMCLAIAWQKLHRAADAQSAMAALRTAASDENDQAYQYAQVYSQWGNKDEALTWLETAYRIRDPGLLQLKVDVFMDPIRAEPRFRSILAKMKFPD
jgi:TolB-like protein/Tfp pilus assembly protein PilF